MVVVGGGLLGLEMAASLREVGTKVSIIQRTSRFLNRQLDPLGSQLLQEEMVNQGCDLYFNDEVELYYGRARLMGVGLRSGRRPDCDVLILAIGTAPNLELARDCGLACQRGVVVDAHLQTSDPSVFALGEITEFEGTLYGITAAAEQQAAVLARYLSGDVGSVYRGPAPGHRRGLRLAQRAGHQHRRGHRLRLVPPRSAAHFGGWLGNGRINLTGRFSPPEPMPTTMPPQTHTIKINLASGIVPAGDLLAIPEAAERAEVEYVQFGNR